MPLPLGAICRRSRTVSQFIDSLRVGGCYRNVTQNALISLLHRDGAMTCRGRGGAACARGWHWGDEAWDAWLSEWLASRVLRKAGGSREASTSLQWCLSLALAWNALYDFVFDTSREWLKFPAEAAALVWYDTSYRNDINAMIHHHTIAAFVLQYVMALLTYQAYRLV